MKAEMMLVPSTRKRKLGEEDVGGGRRARVALWYPYQVGSARCSNPSRPWSSPTSSKYHYLETGRHDSGATPEAQESFEDTRHPRDPCRPSHHGRPLAELGIRSCRSSPRPATHLETEKRFRYRVAQTLPYLALKEVKDENPRPEMHQGPYRCNPGTPSRGTPGAWFVVSPASKLVEGHNTRQTETLLRSAPKPVAVDFGFENTKHMLAKRNESDGPSCTQNPSPKEYLFGAT